jgi:hypothetical protein
MKGKKQFYLYLKNLVELSPFIENMRIKMFKNKPN